MYKGTEYNLNVKNYYNDNYRNGVFNIIILQLSLKPVILLQDCQ